MGIGRVNLAAEDAWTSTRWDRRRRCSFAMAPGRKVGYGLFQDIGRSEFWKFDLRAASSPGAPSSRAGRGCRLKTSSNGKVLYIYNAGNTIDLWDAETLSRYLRTITLDGDMTAELFVFPTPPARDDGHSRRPERKVGRNCWFDRDPWSTQIRPIGFDRSLLAPPGAGDGAEPRQHRGVARTCRCSRATSSTAPCSATTPAASSASSACSPLMLVASFALNV